jgi:hypothetical protein
MNRLMFILIIVNALALGHLSGILYTEYWLEQGCDKEMLYRNSHGQEYACHKMPDVITAEEAEHLQ